MYPGRGSNHRLMIYPMSYAGSGPFLQTQRGLRCFDLQKVHKGDTIHTMSELFEPNQMIAARTVAVEDKDIDVRLDMKRQKNAARIGKRVLRRLARGKTHTVVRGGFLGIEKTTHVPETYGYMQGLL